MVTYVAATIKATVGQCNVVCLFTCFRKESTAVLSCMHIWRKFYTNSIITCFKLKLEKWDIFSIWPQVPVIYSLKWAEVLIFKVIQHVGYFFSCTLIIFICCSLCCCGSFILTSASFFSFLRFSSVTQQSPIHLVLNNKPSSILKAIQLCDTKEYKTSDDKWPTYK